MYEVLTLMTMIIFLAMAIPKAFSPCWDVSIESFHPPFVHGCR